MKIEKYRVDTYPQGVQIHERRKEQKLTTAEAVLLDADERRREQQELARQRQERKTSTEEKAESTQISASDSHEPQAHIDLIA